MKKLIIIAILTAGIIKLGIAQDSANVNTVDTDAGEIIDFQDSVLINIVLPPIAEPAVLPKEYPAAEEAPDVETPDKQDSDNGNGDNKPEAGKKKEKKIKIKKEKKAKEEKEKVEEKPSKDESADDSQKKKDDPRSKKEKITDAVVRGLGVVLITIAMILFFG